MPRSIIPLVGCLALVFAAGCGRKAAPARTAVVPEVAAKPKPTPKTTLKLRYRKREAAAILATGLVGAGASNPISLACYADFVHDTADLLDLSPRYDPPIVAGLLGAGLSGSGAAGPWVQLAYADIAASSFDLLGEKAPEAGPGTILSRSRRSPRLLVVHHPMYNDPPPVRYPVRHVSVEQMNLKPLANPGAPGGAPPKGGAKGKGQGGRRR